MKAIGDLPRDIAPARDLWPGIAAAIGADAPGAARPARGIARLGQRLELKEITLSKSLKNDQESIHDLPAGAYFIILRQSGKAIAAEKLIIIE